MALHTFINKLKHTVSTKINQTKFMSQKLSSFLLYNLCFVGREGYWTKSEGDETASGPCGLLESKLGKRRRDNII
jgi:hypothetical protein